MQLKIPYVVLPAGPSLSFLDSFTPLFPPATPFCHSQITNITWNVVLEPRHQVVSIKQSDWSTSHSTSAQHGFTPYCSLKILLRRSRTLEQRLRSCYEIDRFVNFDRCRGLSFDEWWEEDDRNKQAVTAVKMFSLKCSPNWHNMDWSWIFCSTKSRCEFWKGLHRYLVNCSNEARVMLLNEVTQYNYYQ